MRRKRGVRGREEKVMVLSGRREQEVTEGSKLASSSQGHNDVFNSEGRYTEKRKP